MNTTKQVLSGSHKKIMRDLYRVLGRHNRYDARGKKVVGHATQIQRTNVLEIFIRELYAQDYKPANVKSLREKHIAVVLAKWEAEGKSPSTMTTRISILRTFFDWIGKPGILADPMKYLKNPASLKRSHVATKDKTWSGQAINLDEKFAEVEAKDPVVGLQFRLQVAFGLRPREAWMLKPHMADKITHLVVAWGTKGGRTRSNVSIDTERKRALLELAKQYAPNLHDSTIPKQYTLKSWRDHFYYICRQCGITRKAGIVAHGLRHEYANNKYEQLTGQPSPIRGGERGVVSPELDRAARFDIAEDLGHSREGITGAYIGGKR